VRPSMAASECFMGCSLLIWTLLLLTNANPDGSVFPTCLNTFAELAWGIYISF
jgi:hypothetical protein